MIIGGIQKNSFIDFPGKISAVIFTKGCNLCCPYCHNPMLLSRETEGVDIGELFIFLEKRKCRLQGVVISGGEPTIHSDLPEFAKRVKNLGFFLKLDTNGTNPQMLETLLSDNLLDYIAMDLKTSLGGYVVFSKSGKQYANELISSIRIIAQSGIPAEFRTTCAAPFINEQIIIELACLIAEYAPQVPLWLQGVNWENALDPGYARNVPSPDLLRLRELALACLIDCRIR